MKRAVKDECMLKEIRAVVCLGLIASLALTLSACGTGALNGGDAGHAAGGKASDAQIVFEATVPTAGGSAQEIFTMNLDGSKRTQITHDGLNKFLPHFSPDGTRLAYTKFLVGGYGAPNAQTDVVVYDFASAKETQLTSTGKSFGPVWSPDGQRIAFSSTTNGGSLRIMNADGSNSHLVAAPSGAVDDQAWGDYAWSSDDWILFVVAQGTNNCYKTRLDKIRPDGTTRTQVTDGGPNCTPSGMEQNGDADPGFSADGKTIYSSRGFPRAPTGMPTHTERRLYSFSSDAWTAGKVESDLSLPSAPDCIEGVPKGSPDGTRVLLFRFCAGDEAHSGVTLTDKAGAYRTWIAGGFGPDWNPVAKPCCGMPTSHSATGRKSSWDPIAFASLPLPVTRLSTSATCSSAGDHDRPRACPQPAGPGIDGVRVDRDRTGPRPIPGLLRPHAGPQPGGRSAAGPAAPTATAALAEISPGKRNTRK